MIVRVCIFPLHPQLLPAVLLWRSFHDVLQVHTVYVRVCICARVCVCSCVSACRLLVKITLLLYDPYVNIGAPFSGVCAMGAIDILNSLNLPTPDSARTLDTLFTLVFPIYNFVNCLKKIDLNYVNTMKCQPRQPFCQDRPGPCCKGQLYSYSLCYENMYTPCYL